MGNIFSADEKLLGRRKGLSLAQRRKSRGAPRSKEHTHGYRWPGYLSSGRRQRRRKDGNNYLFVVRNGEIDFPIAEAHGLDAIIDELYLSATKENDPRRTARDKYLAVAKPFIPRIKLTRNKGKKRRSTLKMNEDREFADSWQENGTTVTTDYEKTEHETSIMAKRDILEGITQKPDENYFANSFDDCMRRLKLIENEHELVEKEGSDIQLFYLGKEPDCAAQTPECQNEETVEDKTNEDGNSTTNMENHSSSEFDVREEEPEATNERAHTKSSSRKRIESDKENSELISKWYSNLRENFEKSNRENRAQKAKEMSCRITGATLKTSNDPPKEDDEERKNRHYFSNLVKARKTLIDDELPDPDKVQHIRVMFQENLNSTLKKRINKNIGGSLQNITAKSPELKLLRPLSAQYSRDDVINEISKNGGSTGKIGLKIGSFEAPDSEKDSEKDVPLHISKRRLLEKFEKDLKLSRDSRNKKLLHSRWTDSGSVSSGVSSDLSSYETDIESYWKEGMDADHEDVLVSDDDSLHDIKDKHYVQNEILEKIRSFGTSITYYGGEMITCSVGPLLSPTTHAIMEEITEKYGREANYKSFAEFYRKYVDFIQPNRKKKVDRTRSFGQNDVFHKPNILNNTEIEMYKYDLEVEIGLRKPKGIRQHMQPTTAKAKAQKPSTETGTEVPLSNPQNPHELKHADDAVEIIQGHTEENRTKDTENGRENSASEKEIFQDEPASSPSEFESNGTAEKKVQNAEDPDRNSSHCKSQTEVETLKMPSSDSPPKEILFGYEKTLLDERRKSDMEFEEFQVSEAPSRNLRENTEATHQDDGVREENLDKL